MSSLNESIYRFAFCVENHLLLAIFLKLTLVLAVMWLFALALRRSSPQWRILVWRLGSISILLAIGTSFLPGIWRVQINAPEIAQVLPRDNSLTSSWVVLEYNEEGLTDPKTSEAPATHGSADNESEPVRNLESESQIGDAVVSSDTTQESTVALVANEQTTPETLDSVDTAPAQSVANPNPISSVQLMFVAIAIVTLLLVVRIAIGCWRIKKTIQLAVSNDSEKVQATADSLNEKLGLTQPVTIRFLPPSTPANCGLVIPCLFGLFRPTILLQRSLLDRSREADLPFVLAHELAHVKGHDFAWNLFIRFVCSLIWVHPLSWAIVRMHQKDCELVCDDIAATLTNDPIGYRSTLAQIAIECWQLRQKSNHQIAISMARRADVMQRLERLGKHETFCRLSKHKVTTAVLLMVVSVVAMGSARPNFVRPIQPANNSLGSNPFGSANFVDSAIQEEDSTVSGIVKVIGQDGVPVKSGKIRLNYFNFADQKFTSIEGPPIVDGEFNFKLPIKPTILRFDVRVEGHVPYALEASVSDDDFVFPMSQTIRLQKPETAKGVVTDELGNPIADANVTLRTRAKTKSRWGFGFDFDIATVKTNAKGEWVCDRVPSQYGVRRRDATHHAVVISHPDFVSPFDSRLNKTTNLFEAKLKRAISIKGKVLSESGAPVGNAQVIVGREIDSADNRIATSDEEGNFVVGGCRPGPSQIIIKADAMAPAQMDLDIKNQGNFQMQIAVGELPKINAGKTLRGQLVDVKGKPIPNMQLFLTSWRGSRTLQKTLMTDERGFYEWKHAPAGEMEFTTFISESLNPKDSPKWLTGRRHKLFAGTDAVIKVFKKPTVSGTIIDSTTGEKILNAMVSTGVPASDQKVDWVDNWKMSEEPGKYSFTLDSYQSQYKLRFYEQGHEWHTSRTIKLEEGDVNLDVKLVPTPRDKATFGWKQVEDAIAAGKINMELGDAIENLHRLGAEVSCDEQLNIKVSLQGRFVIESAMHGVPNIEENPGLEKWKGANDDLALLNGLPGLELTLKGVDLSAEMLETFGQNETLTTLQLECPWSLVDEEFKLFGGLKSLRHLKVDGKWQVFPRAGIEGLSQIPNLETLDFGIGVSDAQLKQDAFDGLLSKMKNLKFIGFVGEGISDQMCVEVGQLEQLEVLEISSRSITDAFVDGLKANPNLKKLNLSRCGITDDGAVKLARLFPNLEEIKLSRSFLTGQGVRRLASANLQRLRNAYLPIVERESLVEFQKSYPDCNLTLIFVTADGSGVMSTAFRYWLNERGPK